jgi:leucine dehydrogenase
MDFKDLSASELERFVDYDGHEKVRRVEDAKTGLIAYVAAHNTNLGPSLGGCRLSPYENEDDAIIDVLRLSRGMTYKNAMADLPLGGGKSVMLIDPYTQKTEENIAAMGRAIDSMEGQYISAEDSGLTEDDVKIMYKETPYVTGFKDGLAGGVGGNPSPITARGVYYGMKVAAKAKYGSDDLSGLTVSIQGLGAVGMGLCDYLHQDGVQIIATDVRETALQAAKDKYKGLSVVATEEIFEVEAQIFAPCAMGAQINDDTIPQLKCDIVAGAANNQLRSAEHGQRLHDLGVLYAPDFVINSGGVIAVGYEYFQRAGENPFGHDLTFDNMIKHVERAVMKLDDVFSLSKKDGIPTAVAAERLAEEIFKDKDESKSFCAL